MFNKTKQLIIGMMHDYNDAVDIMREVKDKFQETIKSIDQLEESNRCIKTELASTADWKDGLIQDIITAGKVLADISAKNPCVRYFHNEEKCPACLADKAIKALHNNLEKDYFYDKVFGKDEKDEA